jgi:DNA-binding MarR family transcriptional regulator
MLQINNSVKFCLNLAKLQAELSRRLDCRLGGLGFNEFVILLHLNQADDGKMRRIDLAEKVGLTASGITRLLLPMEKVGLIKRESNEQDARSSYVVLVPGGKEKLKEGLERLEIYCDDFIPYGKAKKIEEFSELLVELEKNV